MPREKQDPELVTLWRYNATTGYWIIARQCSALNSHHWLYVYSRDEPDVSFVLSRRKPKVPPRPKRST